VDASLLVATAAAGFIPVNKRAGNAIKPPPPTTESMNAAKKPNTIKIINTVGSKSNNIDSSSISHYSNSN